MYLLKFHETASCIRQAADSETKGDAERKGGWRKRGLRKDGIKRTAAGCASWSNYYGRPKFRIVLGTVYSIPAGSAHEPSNLNLAKLGH